MNQFKKILYALAVFGIVASFVSCQKDMSVETVAMYTTYPQRSVDGLSESSVKEVVLFRDDDTYVISLEASGLTSSGHAATVFYDFETGIYSGNPATDGELVLASSHRYSIDAAMLQSILDSACIRT